VTNRSAKQLVRAIVPAVLGAAASLGVERVVVHWASNGESSTCSPVPESQALAGNAETRSTDGAQGPVIGGPGPYVAHYSLVAFPPMAYRRPGDDSLYYVEGDGRHLAAIARDGVVLWREDLFTQAGLEQYRVEEPKISRLGQASRGILEGRVGSYIAVQFNSTQFGIVDVATGEFIFQGQD
jgi:hypothetical protein